MITTKAENFNSKEYKYFAFISYNSKDTEWGKRLQRKLEGYRMSSTICSERGWKRTPIKPVFFAPTDIQPGPLSYELQERLKASQHLIVVCSPNSAKSEWVGREIEYFHNLGRTKNIHFFIIDGVPNSGDETECFNPIVNALGLPEILGANINEKVSRWSWVNKERAYVQLISKLLNVEFDTIWQRHKRLMIQKTITWCIGVLIVLASVFVVWEMNQPVDVNLKLNEVSFYNENLPPLNDAVVTLTLDNEKKTDTIRSLSSKAIFRNVPYRYINKQVHLSMTCKDYMEVDTTLQLTEDVVLNIQRNPHIYGDIMFDLWDNFGNGVPNVNISIEGIDVKSDERGSVKMFIPLAKQKVKYHITSSVPLSKVTISVPCGENDIICVE